MTVVHAAWLLKLRSDCMKKVRKILSMFIIAIMVIYSCPFTAFSALPQFGKYTYSEVGENGDEVYVELTGYKGNESNVTVPSELNGYKVVGLNGTFANNKTVRNITIPEGIELFGYNTFFACKDISVNIPSSVKCISSKAFANASIKSIEFSEGLQSLEGNAFENTTFDNPNLVLPESLKYISEGNFEGSNLRSVYLGENVRFSYTDEFEYGVDVFGDDQPFNNCRGIFYAQELESINVSPENEYFKSTDGILYSSDGEYLVSYPSGRIDSTYEVPESVKYILPMAFYHCNFENLIVGKNVEKMFDSSSSGSTFKNVDFSKAENLKIIGESSLDGAGGEIIIPDSVEEIGYAAFYDGTFTTLDFETPSSCKIIRDYAFANNSQLKNVFMPNSVVKLGAGHDELDSREVYKVFHGCRNLENVVFEDNSSLTELSGDVFPAIVNKLNINLGKNSSIQSIIGNFPASLTSIDFSGCEMLKKIENNAFEDCKNLVTVDLSNTNIYEIQSRTFYRCINLKTVVLPLSTEIIRSNAFEYCQSLENINLDNVLLIENRSFYETNVNTDEFSHEKQTFEEFEYYELKNHIAVCGYTGTDKNIKIPDTINGKPVDVIASNSFSEKDIESVTFPKELKRIGANAFYMCPIKEISAFPETLEYIGECAFYLNRSLETDLVFPKNLTMIDDSAFYGCSSVENVSFGNSLKSIGKTAFYNCSFGNVVIPDSVTYVGDKAFYSRNITHITYGAGISDIMAQAKDNVNFQSVNVSASNPYYSSYDGVVYSKDGMTLLLYPASKPDETFEIKQGTKIIASEVFEKVRYLKEPIFPQSLETISDFAFTNCKSIEKVHLNSKISSIGVSAFENCDNLKSVYFESGLSVPTLDVTFYDCDKLTDVEFGENVSVNLMSCTFTESGIKNIDLTNCNLSMMFEAFYSTPLESITLNNSLTYLGERTFYETNLKSIDLPDLITYIGEDTFYNCKYLKTVNFNNVVNISHYAFYGCVSMESIDLTGVTFVNSQAFEGCINLKKFKFARDDEATYISENEFSGNEQLETVVIGDSVSEIQYRAFADCTNLKTALISDGVEEIADTAFENCNSLTIICMENSSAMYYAQENNIPYETFVIAPIPDQKYTGKEIEPEITVTQGGNPLNVNEEYFAEYSNNINVGTALVTVVGLGDYSVFASTAKFNIIDDCEYQLQNPEDSVNSSQNNKNESNNNPSTNSDFYQNDNSEKLDDNINYVKEYGEVVKDRSTQQKVNGNTGNQSSANAQTQITTDEITPSQNIENETNSDSSISKEEQEKADNSKSEKNNFFKRIVKLIENFFKQVFEFIKFLFN